MSVVRLTTEEGGPTTYACSDVNLSSVSKNISNEDEQAISLKDRKGSVVVYPFLRIYPPGDKKPGVVEYSKGLDTAADEKDFDSSDAFLFQDGDAAPFAKRNLKSAIRDNKENEAEIKKDEKGCSRGFFHLRKEDKELCNKAGELQKAITFEYNVEPINTCTGSEETRPANILRSFKDASGKTSYINCDGTKEAGPWKINRADKVSEQVAGNKSNLIMDEGGVKLVVNGSDKTCQYRTDDGKIPVQAFTHDPTTGLSSLTPYPATPPQGSGTK